MQIAATSAVAVAVAVDVAVGVAVGVVVLLSLIIIAHRGKFCVVCTTNQRQSKALNEQPQLPSVTTDSGSGK